MENSRSPGVVPLTEKEYNELTEKAEKYDDALKVIQTLTERVNEIKQEYIQKLGAVRDHMKSYPDETDDKYSIERHHPSPAGSHFFNSVLFLTHLETWHKQLKEILEGVDKKEEK